jgi:trans-2,3-dihydro-3-hydroxyanthranilate isomerase
MSFDAEEQALELEYFVVDVFTDTALKGNPLAVVMNAVNLTSEQMQSIAREFNLSETTFIQRREPAVERKEGVRVRIFTTLEELPFAGHPTLGTATVLKLQAPEAVHVDTVTLALNVGAVPVRFRSQSVESVGLFGEMTQRDPEFGEELDRDEVVRLTGLIAEELDPWHPPQVVSTGTPFAIVPLRSAQSLAGLRVSTREATPWLRERGARWFYVLGPTASNAGGNEPAWQARMQFEGGEDPATGSAAGCAISHLVKHGAVPPGQRIHLRQGVEIDRASDLFLSAQFHSGTVTDVRVGGSTVLVAKGQLFLQ